MTSLTRPKTVAKRYAHELRAYLVQGSPLGGKSALEHMKSLERLLVDNADDELPVAPVREHLREMEKMIAWALEATNNLYGHNRLLLLLQEEKKRKKNLQKQKSK